MKIKILSVVGNRPQFIKLKPLADKLKKHKSKIVHKIIHTGQHYDFRMSKIFFNELKINKPDYNLNVNCVSQAEFTSKVIRNLEKIIIKEKPNGILVYGDTNTTLAASICAKKMDINIFHIEAGLRSFDKNMPEEINRIVTDQISDLNFIPTLNAKINLINENINKFKIKLVGDLMYEQLIKTKSNNYFIEKSNLFKKKQNYSLITIHRANLTKYYNNISKIFKKLEKTKLNFLWPCHPRLNELIKKNKIFIPKNIKILKPFSYIEMLACIKNAQLILTDSGGVQKESYFLGKPCIVLRDTTEWVEIIKNNSGLLMKNINDIDKLIIKSFSIKVKFKKDFGTKEVSSKIINEIIKFYEI